MYYMQWLYITTYKMLDSIPIKSYFIKNSLIIHSIVLARASAKRISQMSFLSCFWEDHIMDLIMLGILPAITFDLVFFNMCNTSLFLGGNLTKVSSLTLHVCRNLIWMFACLLSGSWFFSWHREWCIFPTSADLRYQKWKWRKTMSRAEVRASSLAGLPRAKQLTSAHLLLSWLTFPS